jgi:hypothetical protein
MKEFELTFGFLFQLKLICPSLFIYLFIPVIPLPLSLSLLQGRRHVP